MVVIGEIVRKLYKEAETKHNFHSVRIGNLLLVAMLISMIVALTDPLYWLVFYRCVGYTLHLMADALTPMSLPN